MKYHPNNYRLNFIKIIFLFYSFRSSDPNPSSSTPYFGDEFRHRRRVVRRFDVGASSSRRIVVDADNDDVRVAREEKLFRF